MRRRAVLSGLLAGGLGGCFHYPSLDPYASLALKTSPPVKGRLTARFFGVGSVLIEDGEDAILTDGFVSRPDKLQTLFSRVAPDDARIDQMLGKIGPGRLRAILVAHAHHDHAMDAARIAQRRRDGTVVIGSTSVANVAMGDGLDSSRTRDAAGLAAAAHGNFTLSAFEHPHTLDPLFFDGEIGEPLRPPAHVSAYRVGVNYSFLIAHRLGRILVHASTNYRPGMYADVRADVVFLGVATLTRQKAKEQFVRDYWDEVVGATRARLVVPVHWDDFTFPLEQPIRPFPYFLDDFPAAMSWLEYLAARDGKTLGLMPVGEPIDIMAAIRP